MSSFVLLRHGLSEANRDRILQGQSDYPLAKEGIAQINALIGFWSAQNRSFDLIISSPLKRARETAERVAATMDAKIELNELWKERHHGEAEGIPYDQLRKQYADSAPPSPFDPIFGSGESEWELHIRACNAIQHMIKFNPGRYLIVSHGGFLGAVLRAILGISPSSGRRRPAKLSFANTGYADLRFDHEKARWHFDALNSTAHLISSVDN
jgi:uncharacterized phosphatase